MVWKRTSRCAVTVQMIDCDESGKVLLGTLDANETLVTMQRGPPLGAQAVLIVFLDKDKTYVRGYCLP